MKTRLLILLTIIINAFAFGANSENHDSNDPKQIIEALRQQMKSLETLKANYIVDTIFGTADINIKYEVSYIKSKDKFSMSEYGYDGDELIEEARTVYDGINIKMFDYNKRADRKQGMIHSKDLLEVLSFRNNICEISGFSITKKIFEENLDERTFRNAGTEQINGHNCTKVVMISPYKPGQNAYAYYSIETRDDKYYILKDVCLIDDDPNQLLYERRYEYDYSDSYPIPRTISYERFNIDDEGNRTPYYKLSVDVQDFQANNPVADSEFAYFFPEETIVHATTAAIRPEEITDPNRQNSVVNSENVAEVNQPSQDNRTEYPFGEGSGAILLPVHIKGQEYLFLLDTGATATIFNTSLRGFLGEPKRVLQAGTPANPIVVQTFESPTIGIGPFSLPEGSEISCIDISMLSMVDGRRISGILGMDFLREHLIQIDFDKGLLSFLQRDNVDTSSFGQSFDLSFNEMGLPQIKVRILESIDIDLIIDTGNTSSGDVDNDTFEKIIEQKDVKVNEIIIATASGTQKSREIRLDCLTIGPFEYEDLIFGEGNMRNFGLGFLARHVVTLDFPGRKMYLKKGAQFDKIDETDMSGLHLLRVSGMTIVHSVDKQSPADNAEIVAGDIIIKVQGKEAENYEMGKLRELLMAGDGRQIGMMIESNGESKELTLVLEKKI